MAASLFGLVNNTTSGCITASDPYAGQRFYDEQERRYREEVDRHRMMQQQMAYNLYVQSQQGMTDFEREKEAVKPKSDDRFTSNKKLLLLEN